MESNGWVAMIEKEQREQYRYSIGIHTEVYRKANDSEPLFVCKVKNIGLTGVNIPNKEDSLRKGNRITLRLITSGVRDRKEFTLDAKVTWKSDTQFGLAFYPMDKEELNEFNKFLFIAKVALRSRERSRIHS
ncbi:MAG: PilZ domain-containing protein [Chromatiales bacterium]|nr:PilZ domain-containing protein [Chromatiales bacterium]